MLQARGVNVFKLSAVQSEQIVACAQFCYSNCEPGRVQMLVDNEQHIIRTALLIPSDPLVMRAPPPLQFLREVCIILRAGSSGASGAHRTGLWLYRTCFQQFSFLQQGHKPISKNNTSIGALFRKLHAKLCERKIIA
jgi:hypothetical protein